jgi:GGDEF domain-containing protein
VNCRDGRSRYAEEINLADYRRGDDMIKLAARLLSAGCDPRVDFIGHIGGDDFILLFQSADWELRCRRILGQFAEESAYLFDQADKTRGALCGEDRAGRQVVFPLTSLAIGIIRVEPDATLTHLHVSAMASEAKKQAKKLTDNAIFIERRALSAKALAAAVANPGHAVSGLAHTN